MSANVPSNGPIRQLDARLEAPSPLSEEDVTRPERLSRLLVVILRELRSLSSRWRPHRLDFENEAVDATGTTKYRFEHRFGGAVRYWVVDWSGSAAPNLRKHAESDNNTLVLTSTSAGTVTIRVEEAG